MAHATATPTRISGLLIPADRDRPIERIDVAGLEDLQQAVGGDIEPVAYHGAPGIIAYCDEDAKTVHEPVANARATRLLGPGLLAGDYIAGDVVVCGFDGEQCVRLDCPDGFEETIAHAGRELPAHDRLETVGGRILHYEWDLWTDAEGKRRIAVLSIMHRTPSETRGGGRSGEFIAGVCEETEEAVEGGVMRGYPIGRGLRVAREPVGRYSKVRRDGFAAQALEQLRELYAASEPQVTEHFKLESGLAL